MVWPWFELWPLYLSYLFTWILVVAPLGIFWCRLSTVKVIFEFIKFFTFATPHCNRWYCIKWVTGFAPTSLCMGNIQNIQTIIRPYIIVIFSLIAILQFYSFITFSSLNCLVLILNPYMHCSESIPICVVSLLLHLMVFKKYFPGLWGTGISDAIFVNFGLLLSK